MPELERAHEHLGDLISALVDGELTPEEKTAARTHLDGCADCRDELTATEATAALVRGLPPVDPRFGFYERMLRGRRFAPDRRAQRVGLAVATVAAALALFVAVGADLAGTQVAPAVDDMVEVHEAGFVPSTGFETMGADEGAADRLPAEIAGGFELDAVFARDDVVAVAYRAGADTVTVFEQDGELEPDDLEPAMDPMDDDAWAMDHHGMHVVVVDRGRAVYTVVGDPPMPVLMTVVGDLPTPPAPSLLQRARDAGTEVVWAFGLGD